MSSIPHYRLWSGSGGWYDCSISTESECEPAIRSLILDDKWTGSPQSISLDVELVPEPHDPRDPWAIAVRAYDHTIGYLSADDALAWAGVVRRVIASGYIPTTPAQIWAKEYDWDRIKFTATIRLSLGRPDQALPTNNPPTAPYMMLPRASIVQVTKEDQHDAVLKFVPDGGYGVLFVTLHEAGVQGRSHVEVRIDNERIGQLTPQMSRRFLPMIGPLRDRGLLTACRGDITGSSVAAEVRIDAVKANEVDDDVLYRNPAAVPLPLVPLLSDPGHYDLSGAVVSLEPIPPMQAVQRRVPAEPPDGSVVRFTKANGSLTYVAVRRARHWETTATSDRGSIHELMVWRDLAPRVRAFEIATEWSPVVRRDDPRIRERHAVVRFTIGGRYLAAINIVNDTYDGDWYTTIGDHAELALPFGDRATWPEISRFGRFVEVAIRWPALMVSTAVG